MERIDVVDDEENDNVKWRCTMMMIPEESKQDDNWRTMCLFLSLSLLIFFFHFMCMHLPSLKKWDFLASSLVPSFSVFHFVCSSHGALRGLRRRNTNFSLRLFFMGDYKTERMEKPKATKLKHPTSRFVGVGAEISWRSHRMPWL